ncbi:MAG: hypothetical protein WCD20_13360 [Rhodomicrobium sp.]
MTSRGCLCALFVAWFIFLGWNQQGLWARENHYAEVERGRVAFLENVRERNFTSQPNGYLSRLEIFEKFVRSIKLDFECINGVSSDISEIALAWQLPFIKHTLVGLKSYEGGHCQFLGRSLPCVFEVAGNKSLFPKGTNATSLNVNISPQLALFGVSSDFDGLLRGFDEGSGVFARRSHFLKLLVYYPVSESGSQHQGPSEPTNDSRPVGHPSLIRLVEGVFLILLALCSAMAIVKASEYADDRGFPWWIPFLIFFGLTYLFGFHGLDLLDAYFDGRESKAVYTATFSGATEAFRSTGDKV